MIAVQMVMNFLIMPLFFLSGALIGVAHFSAATDLVVLTAFAAVFVAFGVWSFSRIEL